jgi:small nuclear ribonucleoprotein (snRNP)-like protein
VHHYLLANPPEITQNRWIMKYYSLLVGIIVAAATCPSLLAQEKAALQPNATVLSILQGSTGKTVELRLNSGEKIGGKVEQVNDNLVVLSHLTGAEFFDGFINVKDISAVVIRSGGK